MINNTKSYTLNIYLKILFFGLLISCNNDPSKEYQGSSKKVYKHIEETTRRSMDSLDAIWMAFEKKSIGSVTEYDLNDININILNKIDSVEYFSFLKNARLINGDFPLYNRYDNLYFYEFIKCETYNIISILHKDEVCCLKLFYLTFDKLNGELIDNKMILLNGMDGNWKESDSGEKINKNYLKVIKIIVEEAESQDKDKIKSIQDSLLVEYKINADGKINELVTDSVRTEIMTIN